MIWTGYPPAPAPARPAASAVACIAVSLGAQNTIVGRGWRESWIAVFARQWFGTRLWTRPRCGTCTQAATHRCWLISCIMPSGAWPWRGPASQRRRQATRLPRWRWWTRGARTYPRRWQQPPSSPRWVSPGWWQGCQQARHARRPRRGSPQASHPPVPHPCATLTAAGLPKKLLTEHDNALSLLRPRGTASFLAMLPDRAPKGGRGPTL
jgi:hypothetical protein